MLKFKRCLWVLGAVLALAGCGGGGGGSSGSEPPPPPTAVGTVAGKAEVVGTGAALAGVDVTAGSASTKTAADGSFSLTGVSPGDRVVIKAALTGYAPNLATATVAANQTSNVRLVLTPVGASATVAVSAGGVVAVPNSAAQVSLPASGLVDFATKAPVAGSVTVQVTPINPATDPAAMPGNYLAQAGAGAAPTPIESFGAIKIDIRDAAGRRVDLAANQTATIRVPVASRSENVPATIPLYYFNEDTGLWVQEGTATLQGSGANRYYEGRVSHFTFWNCDQPQETIIVRGCVVDASNARIANVQIRSEGLDYVGSATVATNASGDFELPMRRNGVASVFGELGQRLTNVVRAGPSATDIRLSECLRLSAAGVLQPPVIVSQPQNDTASSGDFVFFQVQAVGSPTLRYQWRRNGQPMNGQTYPTLFFSAAPADNGAVYSVVVSNLAGSTTSNDATLTVTSATTVAPFISTQPTPQTALVGQIATFSVVAGGTPQPSYQWQRNGQNIAGATSASFTTPTLTATDNGASYAVVVSNTVGSVTSAAALLTVNTVATAPTITTQPANATAVETGTATFTVLATGTAPLQYQWRRGGVALAGATAASYTTPTLTLADSGASYDVVVSNSAGSVTSTAALLTVTVNNTAQQEALVRMAFLSFEYAELALTSFAFVDEDNRFVASSDVCAVSGSATALLNGAAPSVGTTLPSGANTLAATFTNCALDSSQTYSGSTSAQYNLNVGATTLNGNAIATMQNMRHVLTDGGATPMVLTDVTGNGSVSFTASETVNSTTSGPQTASVVTIQPEAGATLRSAITNLTATAVSGTVSVRSVETETSSGVFRPDQSRFGADANTFTVGGKTYVSNGFIDIAFNGTSLSATGAITVTENGTQIGRIFADPQGIIQIEVNGRVIPFAVLKRTAAPASRKLLPR